MPPIYYHLEDSEGAVEVWFTGGTSRKVKHRPYFYTLPDEETRVSGFIEKERVRARVMGVEKELIKFYFLDDKARKKAAKKVERPFDLDVPPWFQFCVDHGITPFSQLDEDLKPIGEPGGLEDLKKVFFSGLIYSDEGFPIEGKSPVVAIAYAIDDGPIETITTEDLDDSTVLREFISMIRTEDPDALVGYGHDADEFKHMMARAKLHGIKLAIGRDGSEPQETGRFFRGTILVENRIKGRANLDIFPIAWRDFPQLPERTWYELADEIGVERPKVLMKFRVAEAWRSNREGAISYLKQKLHTIRKIYGKLMDHQAELSKLTLRPIHRLIRTPVGEIVESYVIREAKSHGWVFPLKEARRESGYEGGYVWLKSPGMYEEIGYLDFASMYPSIMAHHNISFETVDPSPELCEEVEEVEVEGVTARICKDVRGLVPILVGKLMEERSAIKAKMKELSPDDPEYKRLDALQKAVKVVTNAMYGYMGWTNALLMNVKAARITSAYGRYYIKEVRERAESKGLTVIYIDTDGIQLVGGKREDYEELLEEVNKDLPIRIELEYIAERGIYVAKKKYAHLVEGRLIAKGFEFVRRDYPPIIKEAQKKVVEMALRGSDLDEIKKLINEYRSKILNREVRKEHLIIMETMGKELDKFERRTKGFYVAMWLLEKKGIEVHRGQVLRILVVKGPGSVNERARPAEFFDLDDVDVDYYVKLFDQVMERTLSSLKKVGISEKRTGGLEEWFG